MAGSAWIDTLTENKPLILYQGPITKQREEDLKTFIHS